MLRLWRSLRTAVDLLIDIRSRLISVQDQLDKMQLRGEAFMSDVQSQIAKLTADVGQLTSVDDSAIALIGGFKASLDAAVAAAKAAGAPDTSALDALSSEIEAKTASLAAAVAANTPAAPGA